MSRLTKRLSLCALLAGVTASACTSAFLEENGSAADFRGITIPLPPPSFHDNPNLTIDVDGSIGQEPGPGTVVGLWESVAQEGRLTAPDDEGDFVFENVDVVVNQSCLEIWYDQNEAGDIVRSEVARHKVVILEGDEACNDVANTCSAQDDNGACVCLDRRFDNC